METLHSSALSVAIAGATGFVGRALGAALGAEGRVIGLARNPPSIAGDGFASWRRTDFLSLLDAERALEGVEVAYYLIHSMMPSAHLTQGRFQDFDLIAADNFARSAKKNGVRQVIYLGGLIPDEENLSAHLKSRHEIEQVLAAYGTPVTTLRAGLIVGPGGSSFSIVKRLVQRLPMMLCPRWTRTLSQPIALSDVIALLKFCRNNPALFSQTFDIGGPDILSYEQMMREVADVMGKRLRVVPFPLFSPGVSRLWITLITGAPASLVGPLIQSLRHPMVARERRLQQMAEIPGIPFRRCVREALVSKPDAQAQPIAFLGSRRGAPELDVSSVQRFAMPRGTSATWVAEEYLRWLPELFAFVLRVKVSEEKNCRFYLWPWRTPLLILAFSKERSSEDRALFYVRGGLLARIQGRGRLEMREVLNKKYVLAAVLEFRPRLPWFLYRQTQARVHLWVMRSFGLHLQRIARRRIERLAAH